MDVSDHAAKRLAERVGGWAGRDASRTFDNLWALGREARDAELKEFGYWQKRRGCCEYRITVWRGARYLIIRAGSGRVITIIRAAKNR